RGGAPANTSAGRNSSSSYTSPRPTQNGVNDRGDRGERGDRGDRQPRRPQGDRAPSQFARSGDNRPYQPRPMGDRPPRGPRPDGANGAPRSGAPRPILPKASADLASSVSNKPKKDFGAAKKNTYDKTYVEKKPMNKRAMSRQEWLDIDDFDEDKTGYRKARFGKKDKKKEVNVIKIEHAVVTTQEIPLKVLSEKLGVTAVEITKRLFKEGIMKSVNESIDYDTAALMAADMGIDLEYKPEKTAEEALIEIHKGEEGDENNVVRPPVVTVMGHVDHGKTSLLDKIRQTNVTADEAGGITQSIGAYTVTVPDGKQITFIDTPGHAAFTAMRARGAKITDIVILVVAADDGIMPQTVEAINHAKAANVPIIVAVNKIDKPNIDVDRVRNGLLEHNLVPEEWGGDTILVPVSAKTGEGIDALLETVSLVAEMQELKANPNKEARGIVIEAKLDKGKGPVASIIVQNGTLHTGDNVISGMAMGRIRAMFNDKGKQVKEAGPSMAVSVLGLDDVPNAGDSIFAVDQSLMKQVQEERKNKQREEMVKQQTRVSLDDMFAQVEEGKLKALNIIVKGDVQGSVEAIKMSLEKLSNEEVKVKVIHSAAGAVNESDVMLAESANAIIIGFNVRPDTKAKALAEKSKVDVRSYRIIYELLDDVEAAMKGMLSPKYQEIYMGKCEVRQTFNITGVGVIAGCYVTEGKIIRGGKLRIYREDIMIVEGNVKQLKRFKDDVKEVSFGFECGCAIEGFNEIRIGDIIECYMIEEVKRS
ncbi:MAG: translation initiation factor IF-2, partial [Clostridia bacterium]|nr:translation initiation factor IF-2 [Clostridia bacterium]